MTKRILIVDSEEKNFELLAGHIAAALPGTVIDYVQDGARALTLLDSGVRYALLVTDLKLAHADGLEIVQRGLALREHFPVFISTDFSILGDLRALLADHPNVRLYQRPAESFQVLDDVLTVLRATPDDVVKTIALPTLLEMMCLDGKSCLLEFVPVGGGSAGFLCLDGGELFHAAVGDLAGEPAFQRMVGQTSAEIRIFEGSYTATRNVQASLSALLLRCCKEADERLAPAAAS